MRGFRRIWMRGLAGVVLLAAAAPTEVFAQTGRVPGTTAVRGEVLELVRKQAPGISDEDARQRSLEFLAHLQRTAPTAAERLGRGALSAEELESRLAVFLRERRAPTETGLGPERAATDPLARVAERLRAQADLAATDADRRALAERFAARLGDRSKVAQESLLDGSMSDTELAGRLDLFVADVRAEAARKAVDPGTAALPTLIDAFVVANFGQAPERARSVAFSGASEQAGRKREFVIFKQRGDRMRMHILQGGSVIGLLGYDGREGWSQAPNEPAVRVIGSAEADLAKMAEFDPPLAAYRERGAEVERLDGGQGPIRIRVREPSGDVSESEIDPATMTESRVTLIRAGSTERVETRFSDYRKVGVLNVAHRQEVYRNGTLESTTTLSRVTLDPGLLTGFFERPRAVPLDFLTYMTASRTVEEREKRNAATKGTISQP